MLGARARCAWHCAIPTSPPRAASPRHQRIRRRPCADPRPTRRRSEIPARFKGNIIKLLTDIEQLVVETDLPAKIVIDENSGIIVMGKDVRVSTVAVAQGNLTVTIAESRSSSAQCLRPGQTAVTPRTEHQGRHRRRQQSRPRARRAVSLQELVDGLNALGIAPRDLIAILQAIKASGALQADIEVM
ncbi:MAG: flagellar basal body P-ring protein FlgI [Rubrivivax sp.]